jgi:hypothetical protein
MADKKQRKVNRVVRAFNKGFEKDIAPYNKFRLKQERRLGRDFDTYYVITLYKDGVGIRSKMFDYYNIVGFKYVGREFFWFVNNAVAETVNGVAK